MPSFDETADALYALAPSEFTAARDTAVRAAKSDGDTALAKQLAGLHRPTVTAWLVNLLARDQRETVDGLVELGEQLREAQQHLKAAELRDLNRQRQQMVTAIAQQARELGLDAGARVTDETMREVEATFAAALADPDAAAEVQRGRLTTALSYSGLGPPMTAAPPQKTAGPARTRTLTVVKEDPAAAERAARRRAERAAQLEAAVATAQKVLDAADLRQAQAERDAQDAAAAQEAVEEQITRLKRDLAQAEQAQRDALRQSAARQKEAAAAAADARAAHDALEQAAAAAEDA